jgi:hypothetical protein
VLGAIHASAVSADLYCVDRVWEAPGSACCSALGPRGRLPPRSSAPPSDDDVQQAVRRSHCGDTGHHQTDKRPSHGGFVAATLPCRMAQIARARLTHVSSDSACTQEKWPGFNARMPNELSAVTNMASAQMRPSSLWRAVPYSSRSTAAPSMTERIVATRCTAMAVGMLDSLAG